MREILFRGKTCSGRWAEGSLIRAGDYCCILEDEDKVHPMDYPYLDSDLGTIDGKATPVDPKTVGQFTGMLDKDGKKIFEGDLFALRYTNSRHKEKVIYYKCTYDDEYGMWDPFGDSGCGFDPKSIEIVGNIHDNPELLAPKS